MNWCTRAMIPWAKHSAWVIAVESEPNHGRQRSAVNQPGRSPTQGRVHVVSVVRLPTRCSPNQCQSRPRKLAIEGCDLHWSSVALDV